MTKLRRQRYVLVTGFLMMFGLILFAGLADAVSERLSPGASEVVWTTVFSDTFDTLSPAWSITDNTSGQYRWGVTPYTRTVGTVIVEDAGLWSAGGGTAGSTQSWPAGTYANNMLTWAVIGPFTSTHKVWAMRVRADVQNRIAAGDSLFIGLTDAPQNGNYDGLTLTDGSSAWQEVAWSTTQFVDAPVWIMLVFISDGQHVDAGSLVDNMTLEFNLGTHVYLPLVRRDPTPTPTPTPTSQPFYFDDFNNANSGWFTGEAIRYNEWCRWGWDCHAGDEVVANLSYTGGTYAIDVPLSWHGGGDVDTWFVWPAQAAPLPWSAPMPDRYCIEVRGKIANAWENYQPWWAHWGIIFGANADMTELYTFQVNANHNYSAFRIHNYTYPGNKQPLDGEEVNVEIPIVPWCIDAYGDPCDLPLIPTEAYNTLKVAVKGNVVDLYVNDVKLDFGDVIGMPRAKIGLIGGSWEVTPVQLRLDYFRYDADCPEVQ